MDGSEPKPAESPRRRQQRKTRISFELHDSLIMEDVMAELSLDDGIDFDNAIHFGAIHHELEDTRRNAEKMNLLAQLLEM